MGHKGLWAPLDRTAGGPNGPQGRKMKTWALRSSKPPGGGGARAGNNLRGGAVAAMGGTGRGRPGDSQRDPGGEARARTWVRLLGPMPGAEGWDH